MRCCIAGWRRRLLTHPAQPQRLKIGQRAIFGARLFLLLYPIDILLSRFNYLKTAEERQKS